jgi:flavin reductase (DIM6/NTAB) family NADH-FMN oxidoreductase RutF
MQKTATAAEAAQRKMPDPVAIAIARDAQGKYNPITLTWFMQASLDPPMMAIAIGKARHSLAAIRASGAFVLSFPSAAMGPDASFFGMTSGRDTDKLSRQGTPTQPAAKIDGVLLTGAVANYECRLTGEMEAGDHVILLGEVVAAHVNEHAALGRLFALGENRMGGVLPA